MYQGTCLVCLCSSFFPPHCVCAQHIHMGQWRSVCESQDYSFLKGQAKGDFCLACCSLAVCFLGRGSLAGSLGCCPWVLLHLWRTCLAECSFHLLHVPQGCFLPDSCSHFLEENIKFQTMASLLLKPHPCPTAWVSHYILVLMHKPVQPSKLYSA